ncbi:hypothetical protein phiOC_p297 [Ochrobactrum phage vB_OspM_OC]|nr:hypothetical protein phiOC_p297 [Ochrobactrum phage vB_OspM_OC]
MKIDHILTLIDEFEEAVDRYSGELSDGWVAKDLMDAEIKKDKAKYRLIEAIKNLK